MAIGQFLGNLGRAFIPRPAPTSAQTPPFVDDTDNPYDPSTYGDAPAPTVPANARGMMAASPLPKPPAPSAAAAIGGAGTPAPPAPSPVAPSPAAAIGNGLPPAPPLDQDTQKELDIARQGAPMVPVHGRARNIAESLTSRFLGPQLNEQIWDPAYARQKAQYEQQLQNAALPAQIRQKAEAAQAQAAELRGRAALSGQQAANYGTNTVLGATEHGGEILPDNNPPVGADGKPREGSIVQIGGKPVFFPSKAQQKRDALSAQQETWQSVTPEMAQSLQDLGVKAGDKVPPTVFNQYQRIISQQSKQPKLQFEHFTNQRTGDVTTIGYDPNTGQPVTRHVEKGVAEVKLPNPATQANVDTKRSDASFQYNSNKLDKIAQPVADMSGRFSRLVDSLNQQTPQADALIAPELLTVMAGGQGSGLRMNEAEISRIVGGRTNFESLKAALNKWQIDPAKGLSITPAQRQQIRALVQQVNTRLVKKQAIVDKAQNDLLTTDDPKQHRQIVNNARQALMAVDLGQGAAGQQGGGQAGGGVPPVPASIPAAARSTAHYSPSTKLFYYSLDGGKNWLTAQP